MTITKIDDLTKLCLGPFDYYYHCNEVDELVNHLKSKLIIHWFDPRDKLPDYGDEVLWKLNKLNRHVIYSGEFQESSNFVIIDNNRDFSIRVVHDADDVKCWTYSNLILKYSEIKNGK